MNPIGQLHPAHSLWFDRPAERWVEAIPVGCGRLGAMVYGQPASERIQFNEDTLWTGRPHDYARSGAHRWLPEIRRLLSEGRQAEAESLAMEHFMSVPLRQKAYQPFGDIRLRFDGHESFDNYRRWLDLDSAVAGLSYRVADTTYERRLIASHPAQALVLHVRSSLPKRLSFTVDLESVHPSSEVSVVSADTLMLRGGVEPDGLRFEARLRVITEDGSIATDQSRSLRIERCTAVTLILVAHTSFVNFRDISGDPSARCADALLKLAGSDFDSLLESHTQDHRRLYRRFSIDVGSATPTAARPIEDRLRAGLWDDPALAGLFCHFGRYLLIASSRPGSQPANLQGVWNDQVRPPWDSKWTTNINAQMNYWPAETTGLSELQEPLFDLICDVADTGRRVAREHYAAQGWVLHHNTDLWRGAAPINHANHGIWPTGGAWLCMHLWEHWQFTQNRAFLADRAYPLMRDAARFFLDTLVEEPGSGWLMTSPSNSPEHGGLVAGPAMDRQIVRALFTATADAADTLGVDAALAAQLRATAARLAPDRVGRLGQLQEWLADIDDPSDHHRHVSHLWAVHPGDQITPDTPDLFSAAAKSLDMRGDGGTGWAMAWKINLWARLRAGDRALGILAQQLTPVGKDGVTGKETGGTYPNLFDAHPPFQIDGNFGATSGIVELLVQSHRRSGRLIELLPALPTAWRDGNVRGIRARGGFELDIRWSNGRLLDVIVRSGSGMPCQILSATLVRVRNDAGEVIAESRVAGEIVHFPTERGCRYLVEGV